MVVLVGRVLVVSGVWVPLVVSGFRFRVLVGRVLVGVGPLLVWLLVVWWGWLLLRWLLAWCSLWFVRVVLSRDRIRRRRPGRRLVLLSPVITIGLMCWVVSFISRARRLCRVQPIRMGQGRVQLSVYPSFV